MELRKNSKDAGGEKPVSLKNVVKKQSRGKICNAKRIASRKWICHLGKD